MEVYDYRGQLILSTSNERINLEEQNPGLYLLKILTKEDEVIVKKITKL